MKRNNPHIHLPTDKEPQYGNQPKLKFTGKITCIGHSDITGNSTIWLGSPSTNNEVTIIRPAGKKYRWSPRATDPIKTGDTLEITVRRVKRGKKV